MLIALGFLLELKPSGVNIVLDYLGNVVTSARVRGATTRLFEPFAAQRQQLNY